MRQTSIILLPALFAIMACESDAETADSETKATEIPAAESEDAEGPDPAESRPETEGEAATDASAEPEMMSFDYPRDVTVSRFASEAEKRLEIDGPEWQPGAPVAITGPVSGIILDVPPDTYVSFGPSPSQPILFAVMVQPFGMEMQYQKEGFFSPDRRAAISCHGPVSRQGTGGPLQITKCYPLYRF